MNVKELSRRDAIRLAAVGAASAISMDPPNLLADTSLDQREKPASSGSRDRRNAGQFDELAFGSVRPDGWLLTQLRKQAAGITGHLQHLYAPFTGTAWIADQTNPETEWVPWEVRAYWCDGAMRCGLLLEDQALIDQASQLVKFTFGHPQSDGYLGPAFLKRPGDYRRWPHNVFFRSAMAWHDAAGDQEIVEKLRRHYVDSPFTFTGERNQTNIEAMLWTYERTGDPKLLELAERTWALSQAEFAQDKELVALTAKYMNIAGPVVNMHGVTYAEHSKLPALLYRATGKQQYLELAVAAQRKVLDNHVMADGGVSSTEFLSTVTARDAHETCDLADFPWTWGYLMMATGNGSYGDGIERTTFNAVPGAIRKDWKALQYYSSPNQFLCTSHSDHLGVMKGTSYPDIQEFRYMQRMSYRPSPGYSIVCCPANVNRILPNYIARMWMSDPENNGLAATLYGPCKVKAKVGKEKREVEIHEITTYPYSDKIQFKIITSDDVTFPLHLRIPAWCLGATIFLNNQPISMPAIENGFVKLERSWRTGDVLTLTLQMSITTSQWPEDGLAIERGPLVYAYPIPQKWTVVADEQSSVEFPAWDLTPTGDWNFALLADDQKRPPVYSEVQQASDPLNDSNWDPWTNPPCSIEVQVKKVRNWELTHSVVNKEAATFTPRLPDSVQLPTELEGPTQTIKLVPFASTELRLAVFPHIKADPGEMPGSKPA